MGTTCDNDKDGDRQRIIPKLTPEQPSKQQHRGERKESEAELAERIKKTNVTVSDFFTKCIDYDMLKIFFGSFLGFFFATTIIVMLYLVCIFFFKESMWHFYFPNSRQFHNNTYTRQLLCSMTNLTQPLLAHDTMLLPTVGAELNKTAAVLFGNGSGTAAEGSGEAAAVEGPNRIPIEWFRAVGSQLAAVNPQNFQVFHTTGDVYFYVLLVLSTVLILAVILLIYAFCFVWVVKGNLDLPGPHGETPKTYKVWFNNPFTSLMRRGEPRYNLDLNKVSPSASPRPDGGGGGQRGDCSSSSIADSRLVRNVHKSLDLVEQQRAAAADVCNRRTGGGLTSDDGVAMATTISGKFRQFQDDDEPQYINLDD